MVPVHGPVGDDSHGHSSEHMDQQVGDVVFRCHGRNSIILHSILAKGAELDIDEMRWQEKQEQKSARRDNSNSFHRVESVGDWFWLAIEVDR